MSIPIVNVTWPANMPDPVRNAEVADLDLALMHTAVAMHCILDPQQKRVTDSTGVALQRVVVVFDIPVAVDVACNPLSNLQS